MLDCEAATKLILPAFRVAVARRLVMDYGISQERAASLLGVKQASVSKYIKSRKSDRVSLMAGRITSDGLDRDILDMALNGSRKDQIVAALERVSSDTKMTRYLLSVKDAKSEKK